MIRIFGSFVLSVCVSSVVLNSFRSLFVRSKSSEARESALQLAQQLLIPVERCNRNFLDELSGRRPSNGLALDAAPLHPGVVSTLQLPAESAGDVDTQRTPRVWVALDQVVDPQVASRSFVRVVRELFCCRTLGPYFVAPCSSASKESWSAAATPLLSRPSLPRRLVALLNTQTSASVHQCPDF